MSNPESIRPPAPGWMGLSAHVLHALATVGADKDVSGAYLIVDEPVWSGMGGGECVVPAAARYLVAGRPRGLADLMNATSYGLRGVTVISCS